MFKLHEKSVVLRQMPLVPKDYQVVVKRFKELYPDSGRRSQRLTYRIEGGIRFTIDPPDRSPTQFIADTVDLSSHGIGVLHAGFVHFQTPCAVELRTLEGKNVGIAGIVKRCDCIVAPVHHVGIDFAKPIDVTEFVNVVAVDAEKPAPKPVIAGAVLERLQEVQGEVDQLAVLVHGQTDKRVLAMKVQTIRQLLQDMDRLARGKK